MYLAAWVCMERSGFEMRRLAGCMQLIKRAQLHAYRRDRAKIPAVLQTNLAIAIASYAGAYNGIAL